MEKNHQPAMNILMKNSYIYLLAHIVEIVMKPKIYILLAAMRKDTSAPMNTNVSFDLTVVDGARILELFKNLESDLS